MKYKQPFPGFELGLPTPYSNNDNPYTMCTPIRLVWSKVVKLATIVEGDQKAPFSIDTTPKCRRGRYSFPRIAPLYPWYVPYIAESLVWHECSPMVWETWVQSQVASYRRLKKCYLIPPCLTLSNIRYVSRVKWSNPEKGVAPSPTPQCSRYQKGSLRVTLDLGHQPDLYENIT